MKSKLLLLISVFALTACGSKDPETGSGQDARMPGCSLDSPVSVPRSPMDKGLLFDSLVLKGDVKDVHYLEGQGPFNQLYLSLFPVFQEGTKTDYMGAKFGSKDHLVSLGFANDYYGNFNFSGGSQGSNGTTIFETTSTDSDEFETTAKIAMKDNTVLGVSLSYPVANPDESSTTKKVIHSICVKSMKLSDQQ